MYKRSLKEIKQKQTDIFYKNGKQKIYQKIKQKKSIIKRKTKGQSFNLT